MVNNRVASAAGSKHKTTTVHAVQGLLYRIPQPCAKSADPHLSSSSMQLPLPLSAMIASSANTSNAVISAYTLSSNCRCRSYISAMVLPLYTARSRVRKPKKLFCMGLIMSYAGESVERYATDNDVHDLHDLPWRCNNDSVIM